MAGWQWELVLSKRSRLLPYCRWISRFMAFAGYLSTYAPFLSFFMYILCAGLRVGDWKVWQSLGPSPTLFTGPSFIKHFGSEDV